MGDVLILAGGLLGCAAVMAVAGAGAIHLADWWERRSWERHVTAALDLTRQETRRLSEAIDSVRCDVEMTRRP